MIWDAPGSGECSALLSQDERADRETLWEPTRADGGTSQVVSERLGELLLGQVSPPERRSRSPHPKRDDAGPSYGLDRPTFCPRNRRCDSLQARSGRPGPTEAGNADPPAPCFAPQIASIPAPGPTASHPDLQNQPQSAEMSDRGKVIESSPGLSPWAAKMWNCLVEV